jgi:hemerythrin superfamily protein
MNSLVNALSPSITTMIRMDHAHVLSIFHQYTIGTSPSAKQALVRTACLGLEIHAQLEEEIFYPAMRSAVSDNPVLDKSAPEHDEMRGLIAELRRMDPNDAAYDQTFMELMREVIHHVADEETVLLPEAERIMPERLSELGAQMTKRRLELAAPHAGELAMNSFQAASASTMLFAAGAAMAGSYLIKRAFSRHA